MIGHIIGIGFQNISSDILNDMGAKKITITVNLSIGNNTITQLTGKQIRVWDAYDSAGMDIKDALQVTPQIISPFSMNVYISEAMNNVRFELICY